MKGVSEKDLIAQCLRQDRKAQNELFMRYKDAMFTVLFRLTGNREDAEDALQEGFVKVFTKLHTYKGNSSIGSWMKTVFIRTAIEKLRTRHHWLDIEKAGDQLVTWDDDLTGEELEKAILKLEHGYRSVFLLVEVEGYKHKEVAKILGITEGTSKSQLSRAKKKLQGILKDY